MLRGEIKGKYVTSGSFCPITALYKVRTGNTLNMSDYETAASKLGINRHDAKVIANGADDYRMEKSEKFARKALLRAVATQKPRSV
jgi:hypothetical protein